MITEREVNATLLSPTKKDFYQIWNELLDTAQKLSVIWDPTSTNESDPGIVLLKVLTGVADKLNYSIDKNILEQFMPSVTQEESMRKLCDMMGYNIKYYQSATTDVSISYIGEMPETTEILSLPIFSNITNDDGTINYVTLEEALFTLSQDKSVETVTTKSIPCIEGIIGICETDNNDIVSITHIDDNHRYYLPEATIAENGIFIWTYNQDLDDSNDWHLKDTWKKVENLNTQIAGSKVWKFGFDSRRRMPYIQFPEDIATIIEDGLRIKYISTTGINGNISARTLTTVKTNPIASSEEGDYSAEQFTAVNPAASTNGRNIETIDEAYNNFKKTIGTFDTLITCRDYMNVIYRLFTEDNIPLVSNIVVSDIRDDINRSITLCGFDDYGICYTDLALSTETVKTDKNGNSYTIDEAKISNFDILLYPYKTVYGTNSKDEYISSFKYTNENAHEIESGIKELKTISHNLVYPEKDEIVCIKNYLKLKAKITTTRKVNTAEEIIILNNIYTSIYNKFNMRQIDFGEEIPYDAILQAIESADTRIKNVSLDEPEIYTKFMLADNTEYDLASKVGATYPGREAYNKLALRNILAGRIALFDYDTSYKPEFTEEQYNDLETSYPTNPNEPIIEIESVCEISSSVDNEKLNNNEVVSFRSPNYRTVMTYPGYVNYYIQLSPETLSGDKQAVAATFETFYTYLSNRTEGINLSSSELNPESMIKQLTEQEKQLYPADSQPILYNWNDNTKTLTKAASGDYTVRFDSNSYIYWSLWIKAQDTKKSGTKYDGFYRVINSATNLVPGKMIDNSRRKFRLCESWGSMAINDPNGAIKNNYLPVTHPNDQLPEVNPGADEFWTADGFGRDAINTGIVKDCEYCLKPGEYFYINYTESSTEESAKEQIINKVYEPGDIIKPNFDLVDSQGYKADGHSYSKSGPITFKLKNGEERSCEGMFTFSTNQQVEIREPSTVELSDSTVYVYWTLNNNATTFPINAENNYKYTLQENEYFYYTDVNKLDVAFFGYGTEISYIGRTGIKLIKNKNEVAVSSAEIAEKGFSIIPWVRCNFTKAENSESYLCLNEYKYINLTSGDILTSVSLLGNDAAIKNDWIPCSSAEYKFGDAETTETLPEISIQGVTWEVRSKLEINMSPIIEQKLYKNSQKTDRFIIKTYKNPAEKDVDFPPVKDIQIFEPTELDGEGKYIPISFKANYLCQSSANIVDTRITIYENDGTTIKEHKDDFKLHVFKENELKVEGLTDNPAYLISKHNFGDYWTKISAEELSYEGEAGYITLNIAPPQNSYAVFMIYYIDQTNNTIQNRAYLKATGTAPVIFNNNNSWWSDSTSGSRSNTKFYLRPGINVIQITGSSKIYIYPDASVSSTLILSDLDMVKVTNQNLGIDIAHLDYQAYKDNATDNDKAIQLLSDINRADLHHDFYYNCILDNSTTLDLNEALEEKLSSPYLWYDYNNVNNKFVISEISQKDMVDGISIAKSSKI